jgi:hypothetical protein
MSGIIKDEDKFASIYALNSECFSTPCSDWMAVRTYVNVRTNAIASNMAEGFNVLSSLAYDEEESIVSNIGNTPRVSSSFYIDDDYKGKTYYAHINLMPPLYLLHGVTILSYSITNRGFLTTIYVSMFSTYSARNL